MGFVIFSVVNDMVLPKPNEEVTSSNICRSGDFSLETGTVENIHTQLQRAQYPHIKGIVVRRQ